MGTDYAITVGLVIGLFSIPAMVSGYADERFPRAAMAAFILSAAIIALAWSANPELYSFAELPNVVVRVIASIIN